MTRSAMLWPITDATLVIILSIKHQAEMALAPSPSISQATYTRTGRVFLPPRSPLSKLKYL